MVADLKDNARSLIELVSDVLDLARFDAGKMDVHITETPLSAIVQSEVRQATPFAESKGLSLTADLPDCDVWLRTDRLKLARVLSNLIGNALKFTENGGAEVRCVRREDNGLDISVVDTGLGISTEHQSRIFDEFFQLRNPERDRSKGTGLGLAICRRLAAGLGCELSVQSVPGQGSTFTIHVPATAVLDVPSQPTVAHAHPDHAPAPTAPLRGLRILLVDDHDTTRATVAQLLRSRGAAVATARLGREALDLLTRGPHDVLLLDLMLPDIDGSDILRKIKGAWPSSLECVLALSGDVRTNRVEEVRQLGAHDLIPKPITIDGLLSALMKHSPTLQAKEAS
jgi:CheY-like chemotaxis protein